MRVTFAALWILTVLTPVCAITVTSETSGETVFLEGTHAYTRIVGGVFGPGWTYASQVDARDATDAIQTAAQRKITATLDIPATSASLTLNKVARRAGDRLLSVSHDFTIDDTVEFNSLWVSFYLPCDRYAGEAVTAYGAGEAPLGSRALPAALGDTEIFRLNGVSRVDVASGSDIGYRVRFDPPCDVLLQDSRRWGGNEFELRMDLLGAYAGAPVPAGTRFQRPFTVTFPADVDFQLDPRTATSRTDTTGWVPFVMPWDDAPIDLSSLNEAPAGQHGFLTVANGRLEFADGTVPRFWGVCMSAAGNFPTHEQSELIAERMAKFGINMVRTHHADAGWSDPNLFDEAHGDTQHFDLDALDRFDYFIHCLKQQGIYVYLDQLVHRRFTDGDGVASASELGYAAKPYTIFDPTLIALQQQFSRDLWTHVNPYTGIAYKDDPAIALMEFTNENDLMAGDVTVEPYATDLEARWRTWAAAHSVDADQPVRIVSQRTSDVLRFLDEVQRQYYAAMHRYLRDIGVKVPISGNTWLVYSANLPSQTTMDFMDSHAYWDHPYDDYARWHNRPQVRVDVRGGGNNFAALSPSRVHGMPYVCSEWGHPWPNEWRAEGAVPMAAIGTMQGWDGVLAYTYRHETTVPVDSLSGQFNTFNDPCVFGLMPAAAMIFRRADVKASSPPTAVQWHDSDLFAAPQQPLWTSTPAYRALGEAGAVVTVLDTPSGVRATVGPYDYVPTAGATLTESDTGELRRDWDAGVGTVDTPRSQAAYGFLGGASPIGLSNVSISVDNDFAVVAVTSLDGKDIDASNHLLVTAVGRAENTGMVYDLTHTKLHDTGRGPILIEPIVGRLTIDTDNRKWCLYALTPDSDRRQLSAVALDVGAPLTVPLQAAAATIYYELVADEYRAGIPPGQ